MNKQNINTCPVCGTTLENGLCPRCGYLRLIFPEVVPEIIKKQESERISKAKQTLDEIKHLKDQTNRVQQQSDKTINDLKNSVKVYEESSHQAKSEISELETKVNKLISSNKNLETQLNDSKSQLTESNLKSERMLRIISSKNAEVERLQRELDDAAKRSRGTKAFLILIDDGEYSIIPVETEKKYYATGPGMELCPVAESEITMLPFMTSLRVAFSIEKGDSGAYRLTDLSRNLNSSATANDNRLRLTQGVKINVKGSKLQLHFCINQL